MIADYKYLIAGLLGLVPLALVLLAAGNLRNTAIICGTILGLYSPPVAWLYERIYWTPGRLFGGSWGVEDFLFCFHAGAVSWVCAVAPWRRSLQMFPSVWVAFRRLFLLTLIAVVLLLLFIASGFGIAASFLLAQTCSTALIIFLRRSYARLLISAIPTFLLYYFTTLTLWRILMPGFMSMWNGTELTGWSLLGVPIEEYLWVLSFSTGFTLTMAFAFEVRFSGLRAPASTPDCP